MQQRILRKTGEIRAADIFCLFGVVIFWLGLNACSSTTIVDTVFAGEQRKSELLQARLELFNRAVYWGAADEVMAYVEPEQRTKLFRQFKQSRQKEKLVDLNVADVLFENNSNDAAVEMQIRYYEEPRYVVKTRSEKQKWTYHRFGGGWLLHEAERVEDSEAAQRNTTNDGGRASMAK